MSDKERKKNMQFNDRMLIFSLVYQTGPTLVTATPSHHSCHFLVNYWVHGNMYVKDFYT